jgi:hypothetical protein
MTTRFIGFFFLITSLAFGQFNNLNNKRIDSIYFDQTTLNLYIDMAMGNMPNGKVAKLKTLVAKKDVELARWSWTESLVAQFNLNESNIKTPFFSNGVTNIYYPRYLFGLRVSVGTFVLTPLETKKANELYKISMIEQDYQNSTVVTEVTKRYQAYILKQKNLILRLNAETKINSLYNALKSSPQNKDYNYLEKEVQIFNTYTQVQEARNIAEAEVRVAKAELEQVIGSKLEDIK